MEGYLKNLLDDLAESNSNLADSNSSFRIVDDNFNNSFGSLKDARRRRNLRRGSVRRANSTGAVSYKRPTSNESQDFNGSNSSFRSSRSIGFPETSNPKSGVQLSERMERHKQNRWNAQPAAPPPARHSLSPGVLRGRKRHTAIPNTEPLHSSLDLDTPKLSKNHQQRNAISSLIDKFGGKKGDQTVTDRSSTSSVDLDTPKLSKSREQQKPVSLVRDKKDDKKGDHAVPDHFSASSLSAGLFEIGDMPLSNESVINEAIAISDEISTDTTKANKSKTLKRRGVRGRRPRKHSSLNLPPSMPKRRESILVDDDYDGPLMDKLGGKKLQIPAKPVRRLSLDRSYDDSRTEMKGDQQLQIPIGLRDLPYRKSSTHSV